MHRKIINGCLTGLMILFILSLNAGNSEAVEYNLKADATTKNYAGTNVPMWGFALCTDNTFTTCQSVSIPGPELSVPFGEGLSINLKNNLSVPVSMIIPGQNITAVPTDVGGRVMSFTTETAAGATGTYTWSNFKPGTFLYQSGTNPAVHVQMGLYGAVKKDAASGSAYTGVSYDNEAILLFSEVDPVLHSAIAGGSYTSSINFHPKFFLINGSPYTAGLSPISAGTTWQRTLLRFLNAGLRDYVPVLQGQYMSIVAEDGNLLPYAKNQYSIILPAGKTSDAVIIPDTAGLFPIYDRRLHLADGTTPGGMLTYIEVSSPTGSHTAVNDAYAAPSNGTLNIAAPGVIGNDLNPTNLSLTASVETGAGQGTLTLNSDGSFSYSPNSNYRGQDSFTYKLYGVDQSGAGHYSNIATVSIIVSDSPVAVNDSATTRRNTTKSINVLGNDYDPDGTINPASIEIVNAPANGTVTINGSYNLKYTPKRNFTGTDTFTYRVADNNGLFSNIATVAVFVRR